MIKQATKVLVFLTITAFLGVGETNAQDATVYPTLPGTSIRDYSQPGAKIEGNKVYSTLPGTSIRDYSKPGYKIDPE